jgi:hypothetical protein
MKRITQILAFMFFTVCSFANVTNEENNIDYRNNFERDSVSQIIQNNEVPALVLKSSSEDSMKISEEKNDFYDCEVTIKTEIGGTKVDLVVTLYDVSWVGCKILKAEVALALLML